MFSKCARSIVRINQIGKNSKSGNILKTCLSTQEVIDRESKYAAHNYHPLPVALTRGQGEICLNNLNFQQ